MDSFAHFATATASLPAHSWTVSRPDHATPFTLYARSARRTADRRGAWVETHLVWSEAFVRSQRRGRLN